jgi:aminocarboxymuconate-semialdehyde decarboxylase
MDALDQPLDHYLRRFYYDTVPYGAVGTPLLVDVAGAERIMLASDHPHQIGSLDHCADVIRAMDIPTTDKARMLAANAIDLFGIRV